MRTAVLVLCACALAFGDTVVLRDRTILIGTAAKAGDGVKIGGKSVPLSQVLLWEGADGLVKHTPSSRRMLTAYGVLAERDILAACEQRLPEAVKAGDGETAQKILERAEAVGIDPKDAAAWSRRIAGIKELKKSDVKVPGTDVSVALLLDRAQKNLDEEDDLRAAYLLRRALRIDPENETVHEFMEEVARPGWLRETDRKKSNRLWLDWKIDVLAERVRFLKRRHPDMARARNLWRKDLQGVETSEIVFITPLKRAELVGMCVRLSRLTCRSLDLMFKIEKPKRTDFLPLIVYFYENKKEYVEKSGFDTGRGGNPGLTMTAGHYSPTVNASRFFWPENHPAALRSVRDTFVHELTHHWIERRNPRWHARDLGTMMARVQVPGYWIAEGFATFIEEGTFDAARGTWSHFNAHANSLDIVAALAKKGGLIPWEEQYPLTQNTFHTELKATARERFASFRKRWAFRGQGTSKIRLFYEQAAATCHFLYWGEGGKYREQLLDYVTSYYTSQRDKTGTKAAFGLTPAELGAKVEKFAIDVIRNGWTPPR